jgi:uncharacterized protein (DUF2062 family)
MLKKSANLLKKVLREGLSPHRAAIAVAVGIAIGIFPIYGTTTVMCVVAAFIFRLNAPLIFANHYAMSLVKPLLIIPFLRVGEWVFRAEAMPLSVPQLVSRFRADAGAFFQEFGWSFLHATVGWLVVMPFLLGTVYLICFQVIHRWPKRAAADTPFA